MNPNELTPTQRVERIRTLVQDQNWGYRDMYLLASELASELEELNGDNQRLSEACAKALNERDELQRKLTQANLDIAEIRSQHQREMNGFKSDEDLIVERDDLKWQVEELLKDRKRLERLFTLERGDLLWFYQEQDKRRALDVLMEDNE